MQGTDEGSDRGPPWRAACTLNRVNHRPMAAEVEGQDVDREAVESLGKGLVMLARQQRRRPDDRDLARFTDLLQTARAVP